MNRQTDHTSTQLVEALEDEILFEDEEIELDEEIDLQDSEDTGQSTWKILIVDDEEQVHSVTRLALKNFQFDERRLEILSAYSATEARTLLSHNQDTAVVFLDVVMESDQAGLELIRYIRCQLNNQQTRIILRTGQPGAVPELSIVEGYDINDYKTKTELTQAKLFSALITAIRSYRDILTVEESRQEIETLNQRLMGFNQELELQVQTRTQELQVKTQELQAKTQELQDKNQQLEQEVKARMQAQRRLEAVNQQLDQANRKLSFWANFDDLTTLSNRRCFDKYLEQLWRQAFREQHPLCIVLSDIDFFKEYNDNYGHLAGDDCLKKVGLVFRDVIERPLDLAARYGGEEFVVVLHNTDSDGGAVVAQRLRQAIANLEVKHKFSPIGDHLSMSFGVSSLVPSQHVNCQTLIARADSALYEAKKQGRNRVLQYQEQAAS